MIQFDKYEFSEAELQHYECLREHEFVDSTYGYNGERKYNKKLRDTKELDLTNDLVINKVTINKIVRHLKKKNFDSGHPLESAKLLKYGIGSHFSIHKDCSIRKPRALSTIIQLSDASDYDGADLIFRIGKRTIKAPKEKHSLIMFNSEHIHEITPLINGERYSLIVWFGK